MATLSDLRKPMIALVASATVIVGVMTREGFAPVAEQPIPNDRWTYGYGSTEHYDGTPVQPGETITAPEARKLLEWKIEDEYGKNLKRCAGDVKLLQREYDYLLDLAYHVGWPAVCKSNSLQLFRVGKYEEGCKAVWGFARLQGRNCLLPENRNRKDGCRGLINRRQKQYNMCMGLPT